jgi:putative transcriptional regulator
LRQESPDSMKHESGYLEGQMLIAMPGMADERFQRTLIYLCAHSAEGAMGLVVNKAMNNISFPELLEQLGIDGSKLDRKIQVYFGGPVEQSRGFVLHTPDYSQDASLPVDDRFVLTASVDVLRAIAEGTGPRQCLMALGYAGWAPGQLETEIQANGWLHVPADEKLIFDTDDDDKWIAAVSKLGIDLSLLSGEAGHA